MQNVEQAMGQVQLQFMWFSTDRTLYKYSNSPKSYTANSSWKKFKKQMNVGDNFFIVATTTKKSNSESGFSYDVLGILASLADMEELQKANDVYWDYIRDSEDKIGRTLEAAEYFGKWIALNERDSKDFNFNTLCLLEMCNEGKIKEAKKIAKELI